MSDTQQAKYGARPSQVAKTAAGNPGRHEKKTPQVTQQGTTQEPSKLPDKGTYKA